MSKYYIQRVRLALRTLPLVLIAVAAYFGSQQTEMYRRLFTQAAGEPAHIIVDTTSVLSSLPRPWRNLAQGGESPGWQLQPLVPYLQPIRPEYIRIDHLYDFYVIVSGSSGNLSLDFTKLDSQIDAILATGAKPYLSLSYMPPAIATGDIVSTPQSYSDWQLVVQRTIEHVSGTRGISNVYYEVWNEPDLFGEWKYYGNKSYLTLYTSAALGAAQASQNPAVRPFKIGGPATTAPYQNWMEALFKHTSANRVRLDFISWHRYTTDVDQFRLDIQNVRNWMGSYPQLNPAVELHITEWGHESDLDAGYDTEYGAAHTVATNMELAGAIDKAFQFEIQDGKDPEGKEFWGRWGLITANGTLKPRYSGLLMLERLGDQRLELSGKGTWVKAIAARNGDVYQVLLSNVDARGWNYEEVPITFRGLPLGVYELTTEALTGERASQIVDLSVPTDSFQTIAPMPPNSVVLLEMRPIQ